MKRLLLLLIFLTLVILAYVFKPYLSAAISPVTMKLTKAKTIAQRLDQFGDKARGRWKPYFGRAQTTYPPAGANLVALKTEGVLQVYAVPRAGG